MLSVIILNVIMLSVIMQSVITMTAAAAAYFSTVVNYSSKLQQ
jgi:hypothetical protein